jgi:DNA-binding CsgD family transcriptional regulator
MQAPNFAPSVLSDFTCQEMKILVLWVDNLTTQEMAEALNISMFTVKKHRQNIIHKAGVKGTKAIRRFIRGIAPHIKK